MYKQDVLQRKQWQIKKINKQNADKPGLIYGVF